MTPDRQKQKILAHLTLREGKVPEAILGEISALIEAVQSLEPVQKGDIETSIGSSIEPLVTQLEGISEVISNYQPPEQEQILPILEEIKGIASYIAEKEISLTEIEARLASVKQAIEKADLKADLRTVTDEILKAFADVTLAVSKIELPQVDFSSLEEAIQNLIPIEDGRVPVQLSKNDLNELKKALKEKEVYVGGGGMSQTDMVSALNGSNAAKDTSVRDFLSHYKLTDIDDSSATEYYGYTDKDGNWYIKKVTTTAIRFISGASAYTTNWTNRASLTYAYFYETF